MLKYWFVFCSIGCLLEDWSDKYIINSFCFPDPTPFCHLFNVVKGIPYMPVTGVCDVFKVLFKYTLKEVVVKVDDNRILPDSLEATPEGAPYPPTDM